MTKIDRPDGMDTKKYAGAKKWTNKRWAWEFLRRNTEFLAACKKLKTQPSAEEEAGVAEKFGLLKFKNCAEPYKGRGWAVPKFVRSRVHYRVRLTEQDPEVYKRKLKVGELVVRFSLEDALNNAAVVDAKIRAAANVARKRLKELEKARQTTAKSKRIGHDADWVKMLRVLDAHAAKKSSAEMAKAIYPKESRGEQKSNAELTDFMKDRKKRALALARAGYLDIVVRNGKPEVREDV